MCSWKLNIKTNILLRASLLRFGLSERCFFLGVCRKWSPGRGRWPVGAVKVSPEAPCPISLWLESLLRWLDQWRRERFGKGSQGDTRILCRAAGQSVLSRSGPPHGFTDVGICAAPLLPSGEFSHCRGHSEWSPIHAGIFLFFVLQVPTKCLWTCFLPCLQAVNCWHDLDNTEYDCWPINSPNDYNMISCGGELSLSFFKLCEHLLQTRRFFPSFVVQKEVCGAQLCARIHAQFECVCSGGACVFSQVWKWPGFSVHQRKWQMGKSSTSRTQWRPQIPSTTTQSGTGYSSLGERDWSAAPAILVPCPANLHAHPHKHTKGLHNLNLLSLSLRISR